MERDASGIAAGLAFGATVALVAYPMLRMAP